jgi:hypothetical protein
MSDSNRALPPWQPASDAAWGDEWFLCRGTTADEVPFGDRYHFGADGKLALYASRQGAARAARRMNDREREQRAEAAREYVRDRLRQRQPGFCAALDAVTGDLTVSIS